MAFPFRVSDILTSVAGEVVFGDPETAFSAYCIDSRYAYPDCLFVPLLGQHRDGHHFILDAVGRGASSTLVRAGHHLVGEVLRALQESHTYVSAQAAHHVAVVEVRHTLVALQKLASWFRRQFDRVRVVGITGSVGKTQTKEMLLAILGQKHHAVANEKNFNNEIGVPLTLSKIRPETDFAIVEMAMRGRGEVSLLSRIAQPNLALITNTLGSHIGRLGSAAEVARAKAEIIDGMKAGSVLWLNARDHNLATLHSEIENKQAVKRGLTVRFFDCAAATQAAAQVPPLAVPGGNEAPTDGELPEVSPDLWVEEVKLRGLEGSEFTVCTPAKRVPVKLPVLGQGAVENLACAAALALDCGLELPDIVQAVASLSPTPQRLAPYEIKPGVTLVDDTYNASPASTQDALATLATLSPETRRVIVLGDMLELGKYEVPLHRQAAVQVFSLPPSLVIGVGPRMAALHELPLPAGFELHWFSGSTDEDERIGRGFPPAEPQRDARGRLEMVDDATVDRISKLILAEIERVQGGLVILVKGSRALRLERIVQSILSYYGKKEHFL